MVFDGIDGCGKSSHARAMAQYLRSRGHDVALLKEPTKESPAGKRLRDALLSGERPSPEEELRLFVEDRRWDVENRIRPAIDEGKIVVLDRYYYSTVAYQGARGIDTKRIWEMNSFAPRPDIAFIMDIEPEEAMKRLHRREDRDYFEEIEYLRKVREIFLSMRALPEVVIIDSSGTFNETQREIMEKMESIL